MYLPPQGVPSSRGQLAWKRVWPRPAGRLYGRANTDPPSSVMDDLLWFWILITFVAVVAILPLLFKSSPQFDLEPLVDAEFGDYDFDAEIELEKSEPQ